MKIFIFRRDLRIVDNTSLLSMIKSKHIPICIFIFDPQQIDSKQNKYFSNNAVQFMIESLLELREQIRKVNGELYFFNNHPLSILKKLNKLEKVTHLGFNLDYSPYSLKRDKLIIDWALDQNIELFTQEDILLHNLYDGITLKDDKSPYKVFTAYKKKCMSIPVRNINKYKIRIFRKNSNIYFNIQEEELNTFYQYNPNNNVKGGRKKALNILKNLHHFNNYGKCRNILTYQTTLLSAYINFNVVSCREVYYAVKNVGNDAIENELWWRQFYFMIMYHFPHVIGGYFKPKWNNFVWSNDSEQYIYKLTNHITGFPIIDAATKQLQITGFSHNRLRMVLTSFMAKDMLLNPQWIEMYWAKYLIDYSVSATNGGVSWTIGYGTDSMIANRIFNPWEQQKKYDKECEFIKQYIPELQSIEPKFIHKWNDYHNKFSINYPKPIFNHSVRRLKFIEKLKKYGV